MSRVLHIAILLTIWTSYAFGQESDDIEFEYVIDDYNEPPVPSINYLTETAVGLRKGEVYYQNILLFGQKFGFGLTDHFSINAGFEFLSVINGGTPVLLFAPKYTFNERHEEIKFGVGSNLLLIPETGFGNLAGSLYGLVTFGNLDNNLTAGLGVGYDNSGVSSNPVIQLSGQVRLTKVLALVLDSLTVQYDDNYYPFTSLFIRFMTSSLVFDVGGAASITDGGAIPLANLAISLN